MAQVPTLLKRPVVFIPVIVGGRSRHLFFSGCEYQKEGSTIGLSLTGHGVPIRTRILFFQYIAATCKRFQGRNDEGSSEGILADDGEKCSSMYLA